MGRDIRCRCLAVSRCPSCDAISARSGGFDFFATFFGLLVSRVYSTTFATVRREARDSLDELCLFAEIRYESALFIPPVVVLLLLFKMVTWNTLRPYAFVYALTPAYLLPRIWQSILRGNVQSRLRAQSRSASRISSTMLTSIHSQSCRPSSRTFSLCHPDRPRRRWLLKWLRWLLAACARRTGTLENRDSPFSWLRGCCSGNHRLHLRVGPRRIPVGRTPRHRHRHLLLLCRGMGPYESLERWRPFVAVLLAAAVLASQAPVASQHRMMNRLTQTREVPKPGISSNACTRSASSSSPTVPATSPSWTTAR